MFRRTPEYKAAIVEKSNELAEELVTRLHELARQAERQAGALESRVKKPRRESRVLKVIAWAAVLLLALGGVAYAVRRFWEADGSVPTAPSHSSSVAAGSPPSASPAKTPRGVASVPESDPRSEAGREASPLESQTMSDPDGLEGRLVEAPTQRDEKDFANLMAKDVVDVDGNKIGEAQGVYYRERSGEPEWVLVGFGMTDSKSPAPLEGATIGEKIELIYPEDLVKSAPEDFGDVLDLEDEMRLYGHYSARRTLPAEAGLVDNDPLRRWTSDSAVPPAKSPPR